MTAALTIARPHRAPGPSLRDFEAYYSAGATWMRGGDPYGTALWQTEATLPGVHAKRREFLPFVGPPAALPLWSALARLPYTTAAAVWRAGLWLSIVIMVCIALQLGASRRSFFDVIAGALAAAGFGAVTNALALGQIALPVAAAVAITYAATRFGGKALAAAAAFAQPNLALALAGEFRHKRTALALIAGVALFGLLCAGVSVDGVFSYVLVLLAHGAAEQFSAIQLTPASVAYGFGAPSGIAIAIGGIAAIGALFFWLRAMVKFGDRLTLFVISCALVPFGAAFFHQHDLVILFVPAVALVLRAPASGLPAALCGALLCAVNWIGIAQEPGAAFQTLLLTLAFAMALLALRGDFGFRVLAAPFGLVVLLIAGAGSFAHAHVMPVWPDAMTVSPNVAGANAAAVWRAEQMATGLFARDAFWSLLRCASLAGCALLAYAAWISSKYPADSRTSSAARG
ncbi:MAG TPA: hypothetical protein VFW34_11805 [Candidatus Rubrimentiphilum sp.]|nr:hypothetical protein [Candidatus Rubrimentiphilum sp.]